MIVENAHTHYQQAKVAGATLVLEIKDYGGRGYSRRELEGHLWNFGRYDLWS